MLRHTFASFAAATLLLGAAALPALAEDAPVQTVYAVTTSIHAAPEVIWSLLTDAPKYPTWNSTVTKIDGQIGDGQHIDVYPKFAEGRAFSLTVSDVASNQHMTWAGGMPLGLMTGTRVFTLTPAADGNTTFTMREEFKGPLTGMILGGIKGMQLSFDGFGADLKAKAEGTH